MTSLESSVRQVLEALDYSVDDLEGGLLVQRRILGGDSIMYVRCGSSLVGGALGTHLEKFARVRQSYPTATMRLVLENRAAEAFVRSASASGVGVETGTGFFNDLLDSTKIARQVLRDERVRDTAAQYVEQSLTDEDGVVLPRTSSSYVLETWLHDEAASLLVILAPAGHGKTSLSRVLARHLAFAHQLDPELPVPLLVPFAEYRTLQDFRGLILRRLEDAQVMFTAPAFQLLLGEGRAVLILDGFDELSEEAGYEISRHNLRQLSEHIAGSGAKVIITSRSAFFRTSRELSDSILRHFAAESITVVELAEFDTAQQRAFLEKTGEYDRRQIDRIIGRIASEGSLRSLAGSPLLLGLLAASAAEGAIASRPELYSRFVSAIFGRERERYEYALSDEEQFAFLVDVARDMYKDNTYVYDKEDLVTYFVDQAIDGLVRLATDTDLERMRLREKLADHALLDSVAGDRSMQFRHPSFRDFFVADWLSRTLKTQDAADATSLVLRRRFPANVAGFLAEMLDDDAVQRLAALTKRQGEIGEWNRVRLASERAYRIGGADPVAATDVFRKALADDLKFVKQDMREQQFRNITFSGASFVGANLEDAVFERCDLRGCDFTGAVVKQTSLLKCRLERAKFGDASTLVSLKVDGAASGVIESNQSVRQWLYDHGAVVDSKSLRLRDVEKTPEWRAAKLVRHVLHRFYRKGGRVWDKAVDYESLLRGLAGEEQRIVREDVIPALTATGFIEVKPERGHVLVTIEPGRRPKVAQYLSGGEPSPEIVRAVERVEARLQ